MGSNGHKWRWLLEVANEEGQVQELLLILSGEIQAEQYQAAAA